MKRVRVVCASAVMCLLLAGAVHGQTISGSWDTRITIIPSPVSLSFESTLVASYAVGEWTFSSKTFVRDTGWLDQTFTASGGIGEITVGSTLDFAPSASTFERWDVFCGAALAGVMWGTTLTLLPGDLRVLLVGSGKAGALDLSATMTFGAIGGGCDLDWVGVDVAAKLPLCCASLETSLAVTCTGFNRLCLAARSLSIAAITWATLDVELCFATEVKTLTITPRFDFGPTACFKVYLSDPAGGSLFGDVTIDAVALECAIGGVQFLGLSWLGTGVKPSLLADTPYWEVYQIRVGGPDCCGAFSFDVAVYFLEAGTQLLDVAAVKTNLSIRLATRFTFRMGLELDLEQVSTFTKWTLGFLVTW